MASWSAAVDAATDLAGSVRARFDASGLGLLATLRADGFPRISGVEPLFEADLWLGMMPGSRKAADLLRDPRLCLHSATADKEVKEGDAKLTGRAVAVTDEAGIARFRSLFAAHAGMEPPPGPMHLFRVDVTEMSFLRPAGDHLVIEWWREGQAVCRVDRY
ncbi:MAG: pyridoxamine 5'-phosphate oxidase family protein [Actinomycetota bacterium]|nr:pyridoxamine 5'-phosphate oxidase family protein [Actinomycetota bacterium]